MYLIMGCFIDGISLTLVTIPFIAPLLNSLGFDLVWFGVMLVLLIEIGLVTPPVGLNLFVIQGIGGPKTAVADIFLGSVPFLVIALAMMGLTAAFPGIATFLPRAIGL
jgi:TRAP-type C4-dicarboxylate transport system permease large subunit